MAVVDAIRTVEPDVAPLWLPRHGEAAIEQATAPPPDAIEGYTWRSNLTAVLFGSREKTAARLGAVVAALMFFTVVPTFGQGGWAAMISVAFQQSWTLGLLLLATWQVRSVSIPTVMAHWLSGLFTAVLFVHFLSGPLTDLIGTAAVAPATEIIKALPLVLAVIIGARLWRHPGLCDLLILGFAVGGGYAFHEHALFDRAGSGIGPDIGLLVPSVFQLDGLFVIGHPGWTALVGLAIGTLILHRRQATLAVSAIALLLLVVGDHTAARDDQGTFDWVRSITFGGKLMGLVLLCGIVGAIILDRRRLDAMAARDHLFPADPQLVAIDATGEPALLETMLVGRYRRLRNGVHTTIETSPAQWPPMSESPDAPVARLARLARAADVQVGPGSSSVGWAPDPDDPDQHRFVGRDGWTAYVATSQEATISAPAARPDATGVSTLEASDDFWKIAAAVAFGLIAVFVLRVLTAGDPSAAVLPGLPSAANGPPLIRTFIGGIGAALALRGFDLPTPDSRTAVGPADDRTTSRPNECEA